jgi:hypothetical protein
MRSLQMTLVIGLALLVTAAVPATAEEGFSLDLHTFIDVGGQRIRLLDPELIQLTAQEELRLALWNAPMGRLQLELSLAQSSLGTAGLVHGGRIDVGGVGIDALGYAPAGGLSTGQLLSADYWNDLSSAEKVQAGIQVSLAAGVLYYVLEGL